MLLEIGEYAYLKVSNMNCILILYFSDNQLYLSMIKEFISCNILYNIKYDVVNFIEINYSTKHVIQYVKNIILCRIC